jgi:hypothetical protein
MATLALKRQAIWWNVEQDCTKWCSLRDPGGATQAYPVATAMPSQ